METLEQHTASKLEMLESEDLNYTSLVNDSELIHAVHWCAKNTFSTLHARTHDTFCTWNYLVSVTSMIPGGIWIAEAGYLVN